VLDIIRTHPHSEFAFTPSGTLVGTLSESGRGAIFENKVFSQRLPSDATKQALTRKLSRSPSMLADGSIDSSNQYFVIKKDWRMHEVNAQKNIIAKLI